MSALYLKFLVDDHGTVWKAMKESPPAIILMAYCFLLLWFVGGLTGFHLYLIGTNQVSFYLQFSAIIIFLHLHYEMASFGLLVANTDFSFIL